MAQTIEFAYNKLTGRPDVAWIANAKSSTINAGDPVVISTKSTLNTASMPVARSLLAADISASLQEGGSTCGVYGVAAFYAKTDANGVANSQDVYSGKKASAEPILALPSIGAGHQPESTNSYTKLKVFLFTPNNVFWGKLKTGSASSASINARVGLDLTSTTYTVDTAASLKTATIVGWDPSDTTKVLFTMDSAYCQSITGVNFSTN